jgi:hypothetical protein
MKVLSGLVPPEKLPQTYICSVSSSFVRGFKLRCSFKNLSNLFFSWNIIPLDCRPIPKDICALYSRLVFKMDAGFTLEGSTEYLHNVGCFWLQDCSA